MTTDGVSEKWFLVRETAHKCEETKVEPKAQH
jgi:hypothetical protein